MNKIIMLLLLAIFSMHVMASENEKSNKKGHIIGTVIDANSQYPIEYATIALYTIADDKLVTGGITDLDGFFRLKNTAEGDYYLVITFMGYTTQKIPKVEVTSETNELNLGEILLVPNVNELEGVDVVADQASVQYKIDKKVVHVSQQLTATSGTAVDILTNVPSVKVDIDGNVSLRGSGEFTVLIDGRPTVLDPSDALSQIPAGAIENIEIITNPSAKYEPDGTAGIVNIVTKKNKLNGMTGIINANVGTPNQYGADATADFRNDKWHYYVGVDYSNRGKTGVMEYDRWTKVTPDSIRYLESSGDSDRSRLRTSARGGFDYKITDHDIIGINARVGDFSMNNTSLLNYYDWLVPVNDTFNYITDNKTERGGLFYSVNFDYKHNFKENKDHFIEVQVVADGRNGDENSHNFSALPNGYIFEGKKTTEVGPSSGYRFKADYAQPLIWGGKIEAGGQLQISNSEDNTEVYDYDTVQMDYILKEKYSNSTRYTRNTYAAYGIFSGELGAFGFQAGLRTEYTYRLLESINTNESYLIDRPDFFPTVHFSYELPADQQSMLSYTRRIVRPRGHYLEPFVSWMDANNVRQGNPALEPEYVNSLDLGYQKKFGKKRQKHFISFEAYYRITQNKVERISSPWEEDRNIMMQTYENVGTDYSLGVEAMLNYSPTKWYTFNLMADIYDYTLKVDWDTIQYDQHNFSWNSRMNNTFKITKSTRFQLDFNYRSPSVRAQGTSAGFFTTSLAVRQDFFKRKLSATFQVRDVFGTSRHQYELQGQDFYQYTNHQPNTPFFVLSLSYKLNNYATKRNGRSGDSGGMGEDEGSF